MKGRVGGVVLAAGASTRAGCAKALATVAGEPLVKRGTRILEEGGAHEVVAVVGPPHGDAVAEVLRGSHVSVLHNSEPARGMLSSLKVALTHGQANGWDAVVVLLVDQPHVRAVDVNALIAAFRTSSARIVRVKVGTRRGHPYLVTREVFAPLLAAADELGPRPVLTNLRPAITVTVEDPRALDDVDTPADLVAAGVKPPL